jgi:hypothetical protein
VDNLETPLERKITNTGSTFNGSGFTNTYFGDIAEYNTSTAKEVIIDDIYHRFNTAKREISGVTLNYHEIDEYGNFYIEQVDMEPRKEGYFYKPHHRVKLKYYSDVLNSDEIIELENCFNFQSGMTFTNSIVELTGQNDNDIKSLILRLNNLSGITNYDVIRITRNSDKKYINLTINTSLNLNNCILFPYDKTFMPGVSGLNISDYTIRRYKKHTTPRYSQDQNNGLCSWRNAYSYDDLTFTNGRFYSTNIFNIFLKRQDPFGDYGLRNDTFPYDLRGVDIDPDIINKKFKSPNQIC